ncbi:MAG TPA: DUF5329 family protein, partial [Holophagaceae bacterium]|nr:DUF5329 family protein [Holophagaceae bacterium]
MRLLIPLLAPALLAPPSAQAQPGISGQAPQSETTKIEALIQSVEKLQGQAVFVRNGAEHDAKAAGDHLRMKWKNAGSHVKTAGDFIRLCATGSSMSGQPYKI